MDNLNGYIMSGDKIIATVENSIIMSYDEKLFPFYLKKTKDVEQWIRERSIDSNRINSRLLKKALRISSYDELKTALSVNAATVTDTYWFKEKNSSLTFDDIRFRENLFDNLALRGDPNGFSLKPSRTPELTNTGSFEKCWRLIDGKWWLYKSGNELEYFSELLKAKITTNLISMR